jgi:hypothetical protein
MKIEGVSSASFFSLIVISRAGGNPGLVIVE